MKRIYWSGDKGERYWEYLRHIPQGGKPFCDLFAMPGSPFFFRVPAPVETLNDWTGVLYETCKVMQDDGMRVQLEIALLATPYEQELIDRAWGIIDGRVLANSALERARAALWAHYNMVLASESADGQAAIRAANAARHLQCVRNPWIRDLTFLDNFLWRLMHAQIDEREPCECFDYWDTEQTVFAIDVPYRLGDRRLSPPDASLLPRLARQLARAKGSVTLMVYPDALWDRLLHAGWYKLPKTRPDDADIYLNPRAAQALQERPRPEDDLPFEHRWDEDEPDEELD